MPASVSQLAGPGLCGGRDIVVGAMEVPDCRHPALDGRRRLAGISLSCDEAAHDLGRGRERAFTASLAPGGKDGPVRQVRALGVVGAGRASIGVGALGLVIDDPGQHRRRADNQVGRGRDDERLRGRERLGVGRGVQGRGQPRKQVAGFRKFLSHSAVGFPEIVDAIRPTAAHQKSGFAPETVDVRRTGPPHLIRLSLPHPKARMCGYSVSGRTFVMVMPTSALASGPSVVNISACTSIAKARHARSPSERPSAFVDGLRSPTINA